MPQFMKHQLNSPKDSFGNDMQILQPGAGYSIGDLSRHAKQSGFVYTFPDRDDPYSFPYWDTYPTAKDCPEVLVAKSGIVAVSFKRDHQYRVLAQQWSYQAPNSYAQKYLQVWIGMNPLLPDASAHNLHKLVASAHCEITADCVYEDWQGKLRLKDRIQVDHADCDKANNSYYNLTYLSKEANKRLVGCRAADKAEVLAGIRGAIIDPDMIVFD